MKQQKIMSVVIIVLLLSIIAIQLFVKNKVKIADAEGESGVFLKGIPATIPATEVQTLTEE